MYFTEAWFVMKFIEFHNKSPCLVIRQCHFFWTSVLSWISLSFTTNQDPLSQKSYVHRIWHFVKEERTWTSPQTTLCDDNIFSVINLPKFGFFLYCNGHLDQVDMHSSKTAGFVASTQLLQIDIWDSAFKIIQIVSAFFTPNVCQRLRLGNLRRWTVPEEFLYVFVRANTTKVLRIVTAPLRAESLTEASNTPAAAAASYAQVKRTHLDTAAVCARQGLSFKPLVLECTGVWEREAAKFLRHVSGSVAVRTGQDVSQVHGKLLQELCVVARCHRARAVLRRRAGLASASAADFLVQPEPWAMPAKWEPSFSEGLPAQPRWHVKHVLLVSVEPGLDAAFAIRPFFHHFLSRPRRSPTLCVCFSSRWGIFAISLAQCGNGVAAAPSVLTGHQILRHATVAVPKISGLFLRCLVARWHACTTWYDMFLALRITCSQIARICCRFVGFISMIQLTTSLIF